MSDYKAPDTEFQAVANAIRTKGGTQAQLEWPTEFISAIQNIPSGSGSSGVYVGETAPSANIGNNGDYYYKVSNGTDGLITRFDGASGQIGGGWEFGVLEDVEFIGFKGLAAESSNPVATFILGLKTGSNSATIIKQIDNVEFDSGSGEIIFSPSILLVPENTYIAYILPNSTIYYSQRATRSWDPRIDTTKVKGRYGSSFPGYEDSSAIYSVNIILKKDSNYRVKEQYFKSNGAWNKFADGALNLN